MDGAGGGEAAAPPQPPPAQEPPAGGRRRRAPRPHPYAGEASTPRELALDGRRVTLFWLGLATGLAALGLLLATLYSPLVRGIDAPTRAPLLSLDLFLGCRGGGGSLSDCVPLGWEFFTEIPLFAGLGLLGFGFVARDWARRLVLAGWLLFGFYWSLVAQDLLISENDDYVNFTFAVLGTYFFTYLAYHQWLNRVRGVENRTVRFLNVSTFIAAGSYFLIDKIQAIRTWLIVTVSDHTRDTLAFFGQGPHNNLVYVKDLRDPEQPTIFFYSDRYCESGRLDAVGQWCREHGMNVPPDVVDPGGSFWSQVLHFQPDGNHAIIPVSIILACTALQSIMLFVGLFMGTQAPWRKKVVASAIVAVVVYVLNLLRNTGIIWWYGDGLTSFWMVHDAIGKGGSLIAMIGIAFASFAWFPEFLRELVGVLDLPHRDGPVERTLRVGRRRPVPAPP